MSAHGLFVEPDSALRERGKPRFALAASDGADHRAVGKDADHPGRAIEAGIVEQFVDNERAGLLRAERSLGRCDSALSEGRQDGRVYKRQRTDIDTTAS